MTTKICSGRLEISATPFVMNKKYAEKHMIGVGNKPSIT